MEAGKRAGVSWLPLLMVVSCLLGWAGANADGTIDLADRHAQLDRILENPESFQRTMETGQEAAFLCDYCHGIGGSSLKPELPSIASQNPHYMLTQFARYQSGERYDFTGVMKGLVDELSVDEQIAVVVYYSNQPLVPPIVNLTDQQRERGQMFYDRYCHMCHGGDGLGDRQHPRIAGQQPRYLADVLKLFRDGTGGLSRDRHSEVMSGITSLLNDDDIEALSIYISGL
jgi:cytochrome c553